MCVPRFARDGVTYIASDGAIRITSKVMILVFFASNGETPIASSVEM